MSKKIEILENKEALVAKAVAICTQKIANAIASQGRCTIALAGGSTPKPVYEALAKQNLPWDKLIVFWGDERYVAPDHPDSNQLMARQAWLDKVAIPESNIHPMPTDGESPAADAAKHEAHLREVFEISSGFPAFDLILLGMGDDGHTASLFPHTAVLHEREKAIAVGEKDKQPRLTFTVPLINQANCVLFLVAGANKNEAIGQILTDSTETDLAKESSSAMSDKDLSYPARLIKPQGELCWLLDRPAAGNLSFSSDVSLAS